MKAAVYTGYGSSDVIRIENIARPVPGPHEVLIRVRAAALNPLDWRLMRGRPPAVRLLFGLRKPRLRPGRDVAGTVEAIGADVSAFKPGDAVFGPCFGALAEYACAKESKLALKPDAVTFEQAAALPVAGSTALQALRDYGLIARGQNVLVNGAAGGIGTFAVQIAKSLGARVTGVCSTGNLELVRAIGADRAVDYTREDFTRETQSYDLICDCVGNRPLSQLARALQPNGVCVIAGAPHEMTTAGLVAYLILPRLASRRNGRRFRTFIARLSTDDLAALARLVSRGTIVPVIDRRYPLEETASAIAYLEAGHARGKVLILPQ